MEERQEQTHVYDIAAGGRAFGYDPEGPVGLLTRFRRSEAGQSVVEFAMVLPLLGALVLVLISFGKALYYYIDLTHVANEGARIATVSPKTLPGGAASLKAYLCGQLGSASSELRAGSSAVEKAVVTVTYGTAAQTTGDPVTVIVSTKYHWIPFFGGGTMNISGSATMRIENPVSAGAAMTGGTCS
jgi:Flp pilus assembly protein TadG